MQVPPELEELSQNILCLAKTIAIPPPRRNIDPDRQLRELAQSISTVKGILSRPHSAQRSYEFPTQFNRRGSYSGGELQVALQKWPKYRKLCEHILSEPTYPLFPEQPPSDPLLASQVQLSDELFNLLHIAATEPAQDKAAFESFAFSDIGLHNSQFVELMHAAYRVRLAMGESESKFLDIGCGVGTKILGASWFFRFVAGIELDPGYAAAGRKLLNRAGLSGAELFEQDALEFDDYHSYNIIYLFRPISDDELLFRLEKQIVESVAPRTIIAAPYKGFGKRHRLLNCGHLGDRLFLANCDPKEAEGISARAKFIGLAVHPPRTNTKDIWKPVLDAAQSIGFDLPRKRPLQDV